MELQPEVASASDSQFAKFELDPEPVRSRPMTNTELKYADDLEVLREYHKYQGTRNGEASLGALYARHERLMHSLAIELLKRRPHVGSTDDCMSIIRIAAQVAYLRFNEANTKCGKARLSTFLYKTVKFEMLTQADKEAFVQCPSQLRDMRAYFLGGYDGDPVRKANFEFEHGFDDPDVLEKRRAELISLMPNFFILEDDKARYNNSAYHNDGIDGVAEYADLTQYTQEGLCLKADLARMLDKMNPRQREVYYLIYQQGHTMPEAEAILGITLGRVISADRGIRKIFLDYKKELDKII